MNWLTDNLTKILGALSTLISTLMTMIASGTFDGLMDPKQIRWLGIFGMLVGSAITARGFNNASRVRIAEAMQTAIQATPGAPLPPDVVRTSTKPEDTTK